MPALLLVPMCILLLGGCGDAPMQSEEPDDGAYRPGLHALMIEMQFRHAGIWFAGDAENWRLADYQIHEMEELIDDIIELRPIYREARVGDLMQMIIPALEALEAAVERQDADLFREEFDAFTAGCNACHQATDREVIVIQRPQTPPMDNLRYAPGTD